MAATSADRLRRGRRRPRPLPSPSEAPSAAPIPTTVVIPVMSELYVSSRYGYSVMYPADWSGAEASQTWWPPDWKAGNSPGEPFDMISWSERGHGVPGGLRAAPGRAAERERLDRRVPHLRRPELRATARETGADQHRRGAGSPPGRLRRGRGNHRPRGARLHVHAVPVQRSRSRTAGSCSTRSPRPSTCDPRTRRSPARVLDEPRPLSASVRERLRTALAQLRAPRRDASSGGSHE